MKVRLYHLVYRVEKTDEYVQLTGYPDTHKNCMTMKSKYAPERQSLITVIEVSSENQK